MMRLASKLGYAVSARKSQRLRRKVASSVLEACKSAMLRRPLLPTSPKRWAQVHRNIVQLVKRGNPEHGGNNSRSLECTNLILSRRQSHVGVRCHSVNFGWPGDHGVWDILILRLAAVLYGLFGLEIGLLLGRWLTGDIGLVAIILGIVGAVILFCAAYFLEPYRRILLGFSAGALVGLSIASVFGLDHFVGGVLGAAWQWSVP